MESKQENQEWDVLHIFLYPVLEVLCIFYTRARLTSDQPGLGGQPGSNRWGFSLCAGSLGTAHTRRAHRGADGRCLAGYVPSGRHWAPTLLLGLQLLLIQADRGSRQKPCLRELKELNQILPGGKSIQFRRCWKKFNSLLFLPQSQTLLLHSVFFILH